MFTQDVYCSYDDKIIFDIFDNNTTVCYQLIGTMPMDVIPVEYTPYLCPQNISCREK